MTVEMKLVAISILAAIGITTDLPDVLGGGALCLAGAYAAMIFWPPASKGSLWSTLVAALVVGLLVAIVHDAICPGWSLHLMMLAGGLLSRGIVSAFVGIAMHLPERAKAWLNNVHLPWEERQ